MKYDEQYRAWWRCGVQTKLDAPVNDFRLRWRKLKPLPKVKVYDSGPCINLPAEITDNKSGVTEFATRFQKGVEDVKPGIRIPDRYLVN